MRGVVLMGVLALAACAKPPPPVYLPPAASNAPPRSAAPDPWRSDAEKTFHYRYMATLETYRCRATNPQESTRVAVAVMMDPASPGEARQRILADAATDTVKSFARAGSPCLQEAVRLFQVLQRRYPASSGTARSTRPAPNIAAPDRTGPDDTGWQPAAPEPTTPPPPQKPEMIDL